MDGKLRGLGIAAVVALGLTACGPIQEFGDRMNQLLPGSQAAERNAQQPLTNDGNPQPREPAPTRPPDTAAPAPRTYQAPSPVPRAPLQEYPQTPPPQDYTVTEPGTVVYSFYSYVNAGMYGEAYALADPAVFGDYATFADGYATTSYVSVSIDAVEGDVVSVSLVAEQTDGTARFYDGTYTVTDGTIVAADIAEY